MGKDSNLKLQFDELMKSGERAAAGLDGETLEKVTLGLAQWEEKLAKSEVDEDFLNYVRKKIVRYSEICGFVAETMYSALVYASQGTTDGPAKAGYGKNGYQESVVAQPVLMKTYG
jgi:hypothetical protein